MGQKKVLLSFDPTVLDETTSIIIIIIIKNDKNQE